MDAVETMAYRGEVPWHGLGVYLKAKASPDEIRKSASLDWGVAKRKMFYYPKGSNSGKPIEVPEKFALVRDTDDRLLSVVGSTYKPVQNEIALDFFTKFVRAGKMEMETAGSLQNGQYIWGLARLGADFKLAKGDEVRGYLLLCSPHVLGKAMIIQFTPIRVVCWNTLNFALGAGLKGNGSAFRMPHSMTFTDAVKERAEVALGLGERQMSEFEQAAKLLARKRAKDADVKQYFCNVLEFDPKKAKSKKKDGEAREPLMLPKFERALEASPGARLGTAAGTWWGALNAVTYVVDHEIGRERSSALRTAWLGGKAILKRRAVDLALRAAA